MRGKTLANQKKKFVRGGMGISKVNMSRLPGTAREGRLTSPQLEASTRLPWPPPLLKFPKKKGHKFAGIF